MIFCFIWSSITINSLFLCLKIYQKWSSIWSSLGNGQKGVLETSRGRKSPDGDFLGRFWAPSGNQEGPNIDPWSDQNRPRDAQREVPRTSRGVLRRFKTRVDALRWILMISKRFGRFKDDLKRQATIFWRFKDDIWRFFAPGPAECAERLNNNKLNKPILNIFCFFENRI